MTEKKSILKELGERELFEEDIITLNGDTGSVYLGKVEVIYEKLFSLIAVMKRWGAK